MAEPRVWLVAKEDHSDFFPVFDEVQANLYREGGRTVQGPWVACDEAAIERAVSALSSSHGLTFEDQAILVLRAAGGTMREHGPDDSKLAVAEALRTRMEARADLAMAEREVERLRDQLNKAEEGS